MPAIELPWELGLLLKNDGLLEDAGLLEEGETGKRTEAGDPVGVGRLETGPRTGVVGLGAGGVAAGVPWPGLLDVEPPSLG